jgi:hypothetical protein
MPVSEARLQTIITAFLDLGLTPLEMSRTAGLSLAVILEGLAQRTDCRRGPSSKEVNGD